MSKRNPNDLGIFLRQCRKDLRNRPGLIDAAAHLRISKNTLHAYETGKQLPDLSLLLRAASYYKADVRVLLAYRAAADSDPEVRIYADQLKLLDMKDIFKPRGAQPHRLDINWLETIIGGVERIERSWHRDRLTIHLKAQLVAGLYAVGCQEGEFSDWALAHIMSRVRANFRPGVERKAPSEYREMPINKGLL